MDKIKVIIALATMVILVGAIGTVSAISTPNPLVIKLDKNVLTDVTIKNMRTNEITTGQTNRYGEFVYESANTVQGYDVNDCFAVTIFGKTEMRCYDGKAMNIMSVTVPEGTPATDWTLVGGGVGAVVIAGAIGAILIKKRKKNQKLTKTDFNKMSMKQVYDIAKNYNIPYDAKTKKASLITEIMKRTTSPSEIEAILKKYQNK